jgi:hypothetical protein
MTYATVTQTTAVSTSPGASAPVALNWIGGKPTTVAMSWNSSTVLAISNVQFSLDDPQRVASSAMIWNSWPSAAASSTPATFSASANFDTEQQIQFLSPIGAVRLFSTSITAGGSQSVTMKVLQGEGW